MNKLHNFVLNLMIMFSSMICDDLRSILNFNGGKSHMGDSNKPPKDLVDCFDPAQYTE